MKHRAGLLFTSPSASSSPSSTFPRPTVTTTALVMFGFFLVVVAFFFFSPSTSSSSFDFLPGFSQSQPSCPPHAQPPLVPKLLPQFPALSDSSFSSLQDHQKDLRILITGGAGFIGSHFTLELLQRCADNNAKPSKQLHMACHVVVLDDMSRGDDRLITKVQTETALLRADLHFERGSAGNIELMEKLLAAHRINTIVHFGGYAYASESVADPLLYYDNTVVNATNLLTAIERSGRLVTRLIYSSSSAVYGTIAREECDVPLREDSPTTPSSPYGQVKLTTEHLIHSYYESRSMAGAPLAIGILRYFNVIGADKQARLGALPKADLSKKFGRIVDSCFAAIEDNTPMIIYGDDYATRDGSAIRDYIHVSDLVSAHLLLLDALHSTNSLTYNVGIGRAFSVREVIDACEAAAGSKVAVEVRPRRLGDPPVVMGDASRIRAHLGWAPEYTDLVDMLKTVWAWRQKINSEKKHS